MKRLILFLFPLCLRAEEAKPLPALEPLVKRIVTATQARSAQREAYCWVEEQVEAKLDGRGRETSRKAKTLEITRLPKGRISKLIAEDGVPLTPERAQAEEARVAKQLAEIQGLEQAPPVEAKQERGVSIQLEDLMAVIEVKRMERSVHAGKPVLALHFGPKPGVRTSGLGQRFAAKLEGRVLVDEATEQVVLAEGHLLESCWVGGGLLGAVAPPTTFYLEQTEVAPGLWMPLRAQLSLYSRVTFVPVRRAFSSTCRDYRRFVADVAEAVPVAAVR